MPYEIDLQAVALEIAGVASQTTEPEIARRLMAVVDQLLQEAGLPSNYDASDWPGC
jgi:hypothetical protein